MRRVLAALVLVLAPSALAHNHSPYAGYTDRPIRALSAEQQADLLAGRGMGLALAAELNGWPGPLHVLELAEQLQLTPTQRADTEAVMAAMRTQAQQLGERIVQEEQALDTLFRDRRITEAELAARTARIGALQGELRAVHLRAHLAQAALMTPEQRARYDHLRGYGGQPQGGGHHGHRRQ